MNTPDKKIRVSTLEVVLVAIVFAINMIVMGIFLKTNVSDNTKSSTEYVSPHTTVLTRTQDMVLIVIVFENKLYTSNVIKYKAIHTMFKDLDRDYRSMPGIISIHRCLEN